MTYTMKEIQHCVRGCLSTSGDNGLDTGGGPVNLNVDEREFVIPEIER